MDHFDFLWNVSQEHQIAQLRGRFDKVRLERDLSAPDRCACAIELAAENLELKVRLGLLVRLLIKQASSRLRSTRP